MATNIEGKAAHEFVAIRVAGHRLGGLLDVPADAHGLVLFAHGSGSGRLSPRNQYVAKVLQQAGIATLLFDLLDDEEAEDRANVFNIPLLAERLVAVTGWTSRQPATQGLKLGYFGASTARPQPCSRPPSKSTQFLPLFHAAVGQIWPTKCCHWWWPRLY